MPPSETLRRSPGSEPVVTRAKKSIAAFKLREGMPIGAMADASGASGCMSLSDRLASAAMPRIRDFRGVSPNSFDGRGNYTLGLREQLMFPEIDYDKIDKTRGLEVSFVTTAKTDEEGRRLLQLLGMPFAEDGGTALMAKKSWIVESEPPGEVQHPEQQPVQDLRTQPGLYAQIWHVPNLFPRNGIAGTAPWRDEVELVVPLTGVQGVRE